MINNLEGIMSQEESLKFMGFMMNAKRNMEINRSGLC